MNVQCSSSNNHVVLGIMDMPKFSLILGKELTKISVPLTKISHILGFLVIPNRH